MNCDLLFNDLNFKNNFLVDNYFKEKFDIQYIYNEFGKLFHLLEDIPFKNDLTDHELAIIYNFLYISFAKCNLKSNRQLYANIDNALDLDFLMVIEYLHQRVDIKCCSKDDYFAILQQLSAYIISNRFLGIKKLYLLQIILVYQLQLLTNGFTNQAIKLSTYFENGPLFDHQTECVSRENILFFGLFLNTAVTTLTFHQIQSQINIINCACYIKILNYTEALRFLNILENDKKFTSYVIYIKAFIDFNKNELVSGLEKLNILLEDKLLPTILIDNLYILTGLCFSKQKKHNLSIQMLKKCLLNNENCYLSIILIAYQYKLLNKFDLQLQCLKLLCQMMKNRGSLFTNSLSLNIENVIPDCFFSYIQLDYRDILYVFAKECFINKRFEESNKSYLEIIALPYTFCIETHKLSKAISHTEFIISEPTEIYLETLESHIESNKLEEALNICNLISNKLDFDWMDSIGNEQINLKRSLRDHVNDSDLIFFEINFMDKKSTILYMMKKLTEATILISSAISLMENLCKFTNIFEESNRKKLKYNSDIQCKMELKFKTFNILSNLYEKKANFLFDIDKYQDALHFYRLAHNISQDDVEKTFSFVKCLYKLNRAKEASKLWLNLRGLPSSSIDKLSIHQIIDQKNKLFNIDSTNNDVPSCLNVENVKKKYCMEDIQSLNILLSDK